jgi:hypothetical protein
MNLPYPFRHRDGPHLEKEHDPFMHKQKTCTKRHSLDMGQVDGLLKILEDPIDYDNAQYPAESLSHQTFQNIISWLPDKNMEWEEDVIELVHPLDKK